MRLALAVGAVSAWVALLVMGWSAGGAVYLLLAVAVALFPWRLLRADAGARPVDGEDARK